MDNTNYKEHVKERIAAGLYEPGYLQIRIRELHFALSLAHNNNPSVTHFLIQCYQEILENK